MSDPKVAVFLDRDGTIVETDVHDGKPFAITDPHRIRLVDGAIEGCKLLRDAGFALVMVTNQPDVARGGVRRQDVEIVNASLSEALGLDIALACYHDDADGCDCRKPLPGLLHDAAEQLGLVLDKRSFMIGDRWRDVGAGHAAGVTTVFIDRGYLEPLRYQPDRTTTSLTSAVALVLDTGRNPTWQALQN